MYSTSAKMSAMDLLFPLYQETGVYLILKAPPDVFFFVRWAACPIYIREAMQLHLIRLTVP